MPPSCRLVFALAIFALVGCSEGPRASVEPHVSKSKQAITANPSLPPTRQLRRITLALRGVEPTLSEYRALLAASTEAERASLISKAIDDGLASPGFYDEMLSFGHDWMRTSDYAFGQINPGWWLGGNAVFLEQCPTGSVHAGKWYTPQSYVTGPCDDSAARVDQIQDPWWAVGTTVTTVGNAGSGKRVSSSGVDCGLVDNQRQSRSIFREGGDDCSCGPNLIYCYPKTYYFLAGNYFDEDGDARREGRPRRSLWEEPARLVAHVAVNDRPLTDLVLGDYTVANLKLQHAYVRAARQAGSSVASLDDDGWWRTVTDPLAWREVKISSMNPLLLADRDYKYDPRTDTAQAKGIPSAGVLTMLGSMAAFPRERVRAARWLEILACQQFNAPDPSAVFNAFKNDPSREGSCQHCHGAGGIEATAIHFKRIAIRDSGDIVFGGVGPWTWNGLKKNGSNQRDAEPLERWTSAFIPGTGLTPASDTQITAHPEARLIDFLDANESLFGGKSDGTIGPLGFAKMLVASGAFDRCATRKLYGRVFGRELDPATEGPYLDELTKQFIADGRKVRPFIRRLLASDEFKRGF